MPILIVSHDALPARHPYSIDAFLVDRTMQATTRAVVSRTRIRTKIDLLSMVPMYSRGLNDYQNCVPYSEDSYGI